MGCKAKPPTPFWNECETHFAIQERVDETRAALWGSVVTGALAGLKADVVAGGLTLGAGMLVGGVIGGLGGAGIARGMNRLAGANQPEARWSSDFLNALVRSSVLRYLAVAHFGRGRGKYVEGEAPPFWRDEVEQQFSQHEAAFRALWDAALEIVTAGAADAPTAGQHREVDRRSARKPLSRHRSRRAAAARVTASSAGTRLAIAVRPGMSPVQHGGGMNKDQVKGRTNTVTGKIKEEVGKATGDKDLEVKGTAEKVGGKVRSAFGDVKSDIKKAHVKSFRPVVRWQCAGQLAGAGSLLPGHHQSTRTAPCVQGAAGHAAAVLRIVDTARPPHCS